VDPRHFRGCAPFRAPASGRALKAAARRAGGFTWAAPLPPPTKPARTARQQSLLDRALASCEEAHRRHHDILAQGWAKTAITTGRYKGLITRPSGPGSLTTHPYPPPPPPRHAQKGPSIRKVAYRAPRPPRQKQVFRPAYVPTWDATPIPPRAPRRRSPTPATTPALFEGTLSSSPRLVREATATPVAPFSGPRPDYLLGRLRRQPAFKPALRMSLVDRRARLYRLARSEGEIRNSLKRIVSRPMPRICRVSTPVPPHRRAYKQKLEYLSPLYPSPPPLVDREPAKMRPFVDALVWVEVPDCTRAIYTSKGSVVTITIESIVCMEKVLLSEALANNRLVHSLVGNISPINVMNADVGDRYKTRETSAKGEWQGKQIPALNNATLVLDEYLFGQANSSIPNVLGFDSVPLALRRETPTQRLNSNGDYLLFDRSSKFIRHFPYSDGRPDELFSDNPGTVLLSAFNRLTKMEPRPANIAPVPKSLDLYLPYGQEGMAMHAYYGVGASEKAFKSAESLMAPYRFTSVRGNKSIPGWEANLHTRQIRMSGLARAESEGQAYFTFMYNLWSMYTQKMIEDTVDPSALGGGAGSGWGPSSTPRYAAPVPAPHFARHIPALTSVEVISNIVPTLTPATLNFDPEGALWDNGGVNASNIANGKTAFIDYGAMANLRMLKLAIKAFAPQGKAWARRFRAVGAGPQGQDKYYYSRPGNNGYASGTDYDSAEVGSKHFVVHWGQLPLLPGSTSNPLSAAEYLLGVSPTAALQSASPWNLDFSTGEIRELMEHYCTKHHAMADCWAAYDAVMYDTFGIQGSGLPGLIPNATNSSIPPTFNIGTRLPRDYTLPAYFDCVRRMAMTAVDGQDLNAIWSMRPLHYMWTANLATVALGASWNWAARSLSISGEVLTELQRIQASTPPAASSNDYSRNFAVMIGYRQTPDSLSPLERFHVKATSIMYGFGPRDTTMRSFIGSYPTTRFHDRRAPYCWSPYYDMWALKALPRSQALPLKGDLPSWPVNEAKPSIDRSSADRIRVARDTDPFIGRPYVQDGGMIANLQLYTAIGDETKSYRHQANGPDLSTRFDYGAWNSPFQYEWPTAAGLFSPDFMGAVGSPFADFLVPNLLSYRVIDNRIQAMGIKLKANPPAQLAIHTKDAWFDLSSSTLPRSLGITYRHPFHAYTEEAPVTDYSLLIFATQTDDFDRIEIQRYSAATAALPTPPLVPGDFGGSAPPPVLPAHLANANPPATFGTPAHPLSRPRASGPILNAARAARKVAERAAIEAEAYARAQSELRKAPPAPPPPPSFSSPPAPSYAVRGERPPPEDVDAFIAYMEGIHSAPQQPPTPPGRQQRPPPPSRSKQAGFSYGHKNPTTVETTATTGAASVAASSSKPGEIRATKASKGPEHKATVGPLPSEPVVASDSAAAEVQQPIIRNLGDFPAPKANYGTTAFENPVPTDDSAYFSQAFPINELDPKQFYSSAIPVHEFPLSPEFSGTAPDGPKN
jgi:hypothetical protein